MKSIAAVFYGLALATSVWSQAASPAFEVASIKPSKAPAALADGRVPGQMIRDPGRVTLTYVSVQNLLAQAYRIKNFQISGPDWLDSERFDIVAKLPKDADEEQLPAMLQSLLRDRFRLAFHLESRTVTAYVLVTAKGGPKMSAVDDTTPSGVRTTAGPIRRHLSGKIGMMYLAGLLSNMLDRPVVDMTELSGRYDVDLDWSDTSETGRMPRSRQTTRHLSLRLFRRSLVCALRRARHRSVSMPSTTWSAFRPRIDCRAC